MEETHFKVGDLALVPSKVGIIKVIEVLEYGRYRVQGVSPWAFPFRRHGTSHLDHLKPEEFFDLIPFDFMDQKCAKIDDKELSFFKTLFE